MSGTRQKYHCGSASVMAFDPAKRSYPYSKNRSDISSHPVHRHGALHGAAFPFRAKQSNVFILPVCSFQGASKGRKNPLTYKPKKRPLLQPILKILCIFFKMVVRIKSPSLISRTGRYFMQVCAKFVIVCEKYTILNHLIALEHTATKPVVFLCK